MKPPLSLQDHAWIVAVPKRAEFSEPLFHFGERVKFCQGQGGDRSWETGRIIGMKFTDFDQWVFTIILDLDSSLSQCGIQEIIAKQTELYLVKDSFTLRAALEAQPQWLNTAEAAKSLGISSAQLRKLRLKGMFKSGYHYRDVSVPNSGLPRWQWHIGNCSKALAVPSEKRATQLIL